MLFNVVQGVQVVQVVQMVVSRTSKFISTLYAQSKSPHPGPLLKEREPLVTSNS